MYWYVINSKSIISSAVFTSDFLNNIIVVMQIAFFHGETTKKESHSFFNLPSGPRILSSYIRVLMEPDASFE